LKIYVTPFKMQNYPFGGNYPQVKNHCLTGRPPKIQGLLRYFLMT